MELSVCYVNFLGEFSHHLPVIFGVPQGSCLALFSRIHFKPKRILA